MFLIETVCDIWLCLLMQHIYSAFGGTSKGIYYKDLVCGLVLLTRGSLLDRLKCEYLILMSMATGVWKIKP